MASRSSRGETVRLLVETPRRARRRVAEAEAGSGGEYEAMTTSFLDSLEYANLPAQGIHLPFHLPRPNLCFECVSKFLELAAADLAGGGPKVRLAGSGNGDLGLGGGATYVSAEAAPGDELYGSLQPRRCTHKPLLSNLFSGAGFPSSFRVSGRMYWYRSSPASPRFFDCTKKRAPLEWPIMRRKTNVECP